MFSIEYRTCRLRKKAQHEANKLKLQGLNEEHSQLFLIDQLTIIRTYVVFRSINRYNCINQITHSSTI